MVPAAEASGASPQVAQAVAAALALGSEALESVQGITTAIITAAGKALTESDAHGLRYVLHMRYIRLALDRTC